MKTIFRITVAVAALAAAGCNTLPEGSLGKTFSAEPYLNMAIPGDSFNAQLAREYQKLAAYNAETEVNWIDATAYIERSKAAAAGNPMPLYNPADFGLSGDVVAMREQVLGMTDCAVAWAAYDFYVESLWQAPGQDPDMARAKLDAAMQSCGAATGMTVYFAFGSARVDAAGEQVIMGVVDSISGMSKLVSLVGHTDTVGSVASNQRLSERRAGSVKNSMVAKGVASDAITTSGRGEQDLAVQTGNGVREQLNRRVDISVSN